MSILADPPKGGGTGTVPQPNLNPFHDARAQRVIDAVLANIDNWQERIAEIEAVAIPTNKVRALSLMRDMEQARVSLCRLAGKTDCD